MRLRITFAKQGALRYIGHRLGRHLALVRAAGEDEDLQRRKKLPVFTAGTGLYLRALLEGLSDAPRRSAP